MSTGKIKLLSEDEIEYILDTFKVVDGKLFRWYRDIKWKEIENKANRNDGYCQVQVYKRIIRYHRLIYILHHKQDVPEGMMLDHISGDRLNNNIDNLRVVDQRQNQQNRYTHREGRLCGCCFDKPTNKWRSFININKKLIHLGLFNTEIEGNNQYILALQHIDKYQNNNQFRELLKLATKPKPEEPKTKQKLLPTQLLLF